MDLKNRDTPVFVTLENGIGSICLNRPDKKNALTAAMWRRIERAALLLEKDPECRVICLKSTTPGVFAAGADIAEMQDAAEDEMLREETQDAIRSAQRTLARVSRPTIAVIDGPCMGGGCGLALHTDFRIASERAVFGITPAKLGIIYPQSDMKRLYEIIGAQGLRRMLFLADRLSAQEALDLGLIDRAVEVDAIDKTATEIAGRMASLSQYSIRAMKQQLIAIEDGAVDDDERTLVQFLEAQTKEDALEGLAAFLEKRAPFFKWTD